MSNRYIEAAQLLKDLFEEADAKMMEIGYNDVQCYLHKDKLNNIYFHARDLEHLEETVIDLQRVLED